MPAAPRLSPGAPKPTNGKHLGRPAPPLGARAIVCARTAPGKPLRAAEAGRRPQGPRSPPVGRRKAPRAHPPAVRTAPQPQQRNHGTLSPEPAVPRGRVRRTPKPTRARARRTLSPGSRPTALSPKESPPPSPRLGGARLPDARAFATLRARRGRAATPFLRFAQQVAYIET